MPFPSTFTELVAAGYNYDSHATCKACQQEIEFWITPRGKKMPMNPMPNGESKAETHFANCPGASLFRRPA